MAHVTVQGGLKQLFNGDRVLFGFETKDPFHCKSGCGLRNFMGTRPIHFHKKKMRFYGSSRIFSSLGKKSNSSNAEEGIGATDGAYDELDEVGDFENDELSCFRGLVLDISYRPVNVVCWKRAICLEFMEKADVLEYYDQTINSPSGSYYIPAVLRVPQLLQVVKRRRIKRCISRKNIFSRDGFTCQYCSSRENLTIDHVLPIARGGGWNWENLTAYDEAAKKQFILRYMCRRLYFAISTTNMKIDFIMDLSFESFFAHKDAQKLKVTACAKCNSKKGPKTVEEANMKLNKVPKAPKEFGILAIPLTTAAMNMLRKKKTMPEEWRQYLSMDSKSSTSEP